MAYHPPKMITNNGGPIYSADLAYEGHGKCGCQTVILSDIGEEEPTKVWMSSDPSGQPSVEDCQDYSHVYKIYALSNVKFRRVDAQNIASEQTDNLVFSVGAFIFKMHSEMYANFTRIEILSGTLMLYRDCNQS